MQKKYALKIENAVFTFMQNMKNIENSLEEATQNFH